MEELKKAKKELQEKITKLVDEFENDYGKCEIRINVSGIYIDTNLFDTPKRKIKNDVVVEIIL